MDKQTLNYVEQVRAKLKIESGCSGELLDLYTLLALVKGKDCTLKDVHDAWAVWRTNSNPYHKSIIPFDELTLDVQELDREYADAIIKATPQSDTGEDDNE